MKRIFIECLAISLILFFCGLYGAVTIRDAQQPVPANQASQTMARQQTIQMPQEQKESVPGTQERHEGKSDNGKKQRASFSEHVQRFFLWGISAVAEAVDGLIHTFAI